MATATSDRATATAAGTGAGGSSSSSSIDFQRVAPFASSVPAASVFRRPLPAPCVSLPSADGRQLFAQALAEGHCEGFFPLISHLHTQAAPALCGAAALTCCLNALNIDPLRRWQEGAPWRYYAEELLDCCVGIDAMTARGITLGELVCAARCNGARVRSFYGDPMLGMVANSAAGSSTAVVNNAAALSAALSSAGHLPGVSVGDCCGRSNTGDRQPGSEYSYGLISAKSCCSKDDIIPGSNNCNDGSSSKSRPKSKSNECSSIKRNRSGRGDVSGHEDVDVALFRTLVESATAFDNGEHLIVAYSRAVLGQTGDGHFSPVGAYSAKDDMVLVLDTARFKYEPHWVPLELLFKATQSMDPDTGRSRGFMMVGVDDRPQSHLFRLLLNREAWTTFPSVLHTAVLEGINAANAIQEALPKPYDHESSTLTPSLKHDIQRAFVAACVERLLKHEVTHAISTVGMDAFSCDGDQASLCGHQDILGALRQIAEALRIFPLAPFIREHLDARHARVDADVVSLVILATQQYLNDRLETHACSTAISTALRGLFVPPKEALLESPAVGALRLEVDALARNLHVLSQFCRCEGCTHP